MKFFEIFPVKFFSIFNSSNREIYVEVLLVLYRHYQQEIKLKKPELVSRLIANMENKMLELQVEDEELYNWEEDINLSGRAHFLLRKFQETGWLEVEPDTESFEELYVFPSYASKLLNLFYDILQNKPVEYNGFVYSTYSSLKNAEQERDEYMYEALKHAHQSTRQLWSSLRELLDNIRLYHQKLQDQMAIKEILAAHFDEFRTLISDKVYHPLKTFDSVPRFKQRILNILRQWLRDPLVIQHIAMILIRRGEQHDPTQSRLLIIQMIEEIISIYEKIDDLLKNIDKKNSTYTRASVERMQYYLNADRNIRGKLVEILQAVPPLKGKGNCSLVEEMVMGLPLYNLGFLDEESLYQEPQRRREHEPNQNLQEAGASAQEIEVELEEFRKRLQTVYSHQKIIQYIMELLQAQFKLTTQELQLTCQEDFIKLLLAVVKNGEENLPYRIEFKDDYLYVDGYRLPDLTIIKESGLKNNVDK